MTKSLFPVYSFANNNARSLASTPVLHIYTTLSSSGSNSTNCFTNWVKRSDTNPWVVVNFEICDVAVETTCRIITYFSLYYAFKHKILYMTSICTFSLLYLRMSMTNMCGSIQAIQVFLAIFCKYILSACLYNIQGIVRFGVTSRLHIGYGQFNET